MRFKTLFIQPVAVAVFLAAFLVSNIAVAAEMRTWTDKKGRTLEGKLMKLDGTEAVIELKAGKEVRIDRELLSAGDNEYLNEFGGGEAVVMTGKVGEPEKDARIDTKSWVELEEPLLLGICFWREAPEQPLG